MTECPHCGVSIDATAIRCPDCLEFSKSHLTDAIDRYYDTTGASDPDDGAYRRRDTFQNKVRLLFPRIEQVAKAGTTATYPDIWGDGIDLYAVKYYLGAISEVEYRDGRPLLSSVIVKAGRGYPADGYFDLVERLDGCPDDILEWSEAEKQAWWEEELAATHEFWNQHA